MVSEISEKDFKKEISGHKGIAVVDFWAPWCGPCKLLGPVFERLSSLAQYSRMKFVKVNIEENESLASEQGIMSIPCVVFFKGGEEVERMVGFSSDDALKMKLNKYV